MKILLLGDYSSVHLNLYRALAELGHSVKLVSSGDGAKNIPTQTNWLTAKYKRFEKISGINDPDFLYRNAYILKKLEGFDVVQIINPIIVEETSIANNRALFDMVSERNGKVFLYACGDDFHWVRSSIRSKAYESMFDNLSLYKSREVYHPLRYVLDPRIVRLCKHVIASVDGIIPGSLDYDWCYEGLKNRRPLIPFPLDLSFTEFVPCKRKNSYRVLHGFQPGKKIRKGDAFFEAAVAKCSESMSYSRLGGLPFLRYLKEIQNCDIFFDQVYSSDQGMNALFALAAGKIVFSGFSERFYDHYALQSPIGVNARPDRRYIIDSLKKIANNAIDVEKMSTDGRRFVELFHEKGVVAERFIVEWGR